MTIQIESDRKEVLGQINQKLEKLDNKVDDINLRLTKVETKLDNAIDEVKEIKSTQKTMTSDVADLKGTKSLIIPIIVAVTTAILTLIIRAIPIS